MQLRARRTRRLLISFSACIKRPREAKEWYLKSRVPSVHYKNSRKQDMAHSELRTEAGTRSVGMAERRVVQPIVVSLSVSSVRGGQGAKCAVELLCDMEAPKSLFATVKIHSVKCG
jgi:hypothetical protein